MRHPAQTGLRNARPPMQEHSVALSSFASQWSADPGPPIAAAIAVALFTQGFVRLRRRGRRDHASWDRPLLFGLGVAVSVIPLVSPIDPLSDDYLLSVHMLEHVLLGDAGPALMVCALRGPLLVFVLPGSCCAGSRVQAAFVAPWASSCACA
jgi:cytochrome c oxidase assembly factor CtaG